MRYQTKIFHIILIFFLASNSIYGSESEQVATINSEATEETLADETVKTSSTNKSHNRTQLLTFKSELLQELDKVDNAIQKASFNYSLYKGLAITGYSLTGVGLGFVILDSLVATPKEDPTNANKFGGLTWSGIPIALTGAILSVTFRILEEKTKDKKIVLEGSYYDLRSELETINNQLSKYETDGSGNNQVD